MTRKDGTQIHHQAHLKAERCKDAGLRDEVKNALSRDYNATTSMEEGPDTTTEDTILARNSPRPTAARSRCCADRPPRSSRYHRRACGSGKSSRWYTGARYFQGVNWKESGSTRLREREGPQRRGEGHLRIDETPKIADRVSQVHTCHHSKEEGKKAGTSAYTIANDYKVMVWSNLVPSARRTCTLVVGFV